MADVVTAVLIGRIGDLLVAGPLLRALKERGAGRLRLVAAAQCAPAAELMPWLDEKLYLHKVTRMRENVLLAVNLLKGQDDLVVDLNPAPSRTSAAIVAALRAGRKAGFAKERFSGVFTETAAAPSDEEHMLDRYARLAALLGLRFEPRLEAVTKPADEAEGERLAASLFSGQKKKLLVVAGNFKKYDNRWPEEKFSELARRLAAEGVSPVFLAGPGEEEPVSGIVKAAGLSPDRMVRPASLGAVAALMKRLDLVVCNITGTTHLAAAVGAPTLGIFSGYTHAVWRPRGDKHRAVVSPDWRSCRAITVDDVHAAVRSRL